MTTKLAQATADAMANAITTRIGTSGLIKIYAGTEPATADTAMSIPGTQQLLATFTLPSTAFGAASSGTITLAGVPLTVPAAATGTASHFRIWKSDGTTCIAQGSVGTSGQQLNLNTTSITSGVNVTITSGTINMPV